MALKEIEVQTLVSKPWVAGLRAKLIEKEVPRPEDLPRIIGSAVLSIDGIFVVLSKHQVREREEVSRDIGLYKSVRADCILDARRFFLDEVATAAYETIPKDNVYDSIVVPDTSVRDLIVGTYNPEDVVVLAPTTRWSWGDSPRLSVVDGGALDLPPAAELPGGPLSSEHSQD